MPLNRHIERKPHSQKYRVVGKGVTVEYLSRLIDDPEWTVERICENYGLTPAEVHAAWAFYYEHQAEIDQRIAESTQAYQAAYDADWEKRERVNNRPVE